MNTSQSFIFFNVLNTLPLVYRGIDDTCSYFKIAFHHKFVLRLKNGYNFFLEISSLTPLTQIAIGHRNV